MYCGIDHQYYRSCLAIIGASILNGNKYGLLLTAEWAGAPIIIVSEYKYLGFLMSVNIMAL